MSEVLLFTVLTLCIVGVLAAVVLYFVAQKFKVYEDPRIDAVESMRPEPIAADADIRVAGDWPTRW